MQVSNIGLHRSFSGVDLDFLSAKDETRMSKSLAPFRKELDRLNTDYYDDVYCRIYETKEDEEEGLRAEIIPYDDYFECQAVPSRSISIFEPYSNFNTEKFITTIK